MRQTWKNFLVEEMAVKRPVGKNWSNEGAMVSSKAGDCKRKERRKMKGLCALLKNLGFLCRKTNRD